MTNRQPFSFPEEDEPVFLVVKTKAPTKWILVDRETGQVYEGNKNGYWDKLKQMERVDKKEDECETIYKRHMA